MLNSFHIGGTVVALSVNDSGFGELEIKVQPPKADAYHVKVKLFKDQVVNHRDQLTAGSAVMVFGSIKGRQYQDKWYLDLNANEIFHPARRGEAPAPPPPPPPPVEDDSDEIPF